MLSLPRSLYDTETHARMALFALSTLSITTCFTPPASSSWNFPIVILLVAITGYYLSKIRGKILKLAFWTSIFTFSIRLAVPTKFALETEYLANDSKLSSTLELIGWHPLVSELFTCIFIILGLLITTFLLASCRFPWYAYFLPVTLIAAIYSDYYGIIGGISSLLITALLIVGLNYGTKLVTDHRFEINQFFKILSFRQRAFAVAYAAPCWVVVIVLIFLGSTIHTKFADNIEETYRVIFNIGSNSEELRLAQEDTAVTIDRSERFFVNKITEDITKIHSDTESFAAIAPRIYSTQFETLRPAPLRDAFCNAWGFSILRVNINIGFLCRSLIAVTNDHIQASFNSSKEKTTSMLQTRVDKLKVYGQATESRVIAEVLEVTRGTYTYLRQLANGIFLVGTIFEWLGFIIVCYSVIASFLLSTARVLFDEKKGNLSFRLTSVLISPNEPLEYSAHDELDLFKASPEKPELIWYVSWSVKRSGKGTYASISFPQFWRCSISRIWRRKFSFCKLRLPRLSPSIAAKVSVPGDHKIVLVKLAGRELIFPMNSLVAFTDSVVLRSAYSAHVGNHFLGLGMFYTFASGDGYIALLAQGEGVELAEPESLNSPRSFLVWDRRQEFMLQQNPNAFLWWINLPSIIVKGNSTAILDERPEKIPTLLNGIFKIARFLFLPI